MHRNVVGGKFNSGVLAKPASHQACLYNWCCASERSGQAAIPLANTVKPAVHDGISLSQVSIVNLLLRLFMYNMITASFLVWSSFVYLKGFYLRYFLFQIIFFVKIVEPFHGPIAIFWRSTPSLMYVMADFFVLDLLN